MKMFLLTLCVLVSGYAAAGEVLNEGALYSTVTIDANGQPAFAEKPTGDLPSDILSQLEPAFIDKARATHAASPREDAIYRLALTWKLIETDGKRQLLFEQRNSEPVATVVTEPSYPDAPFQLHDDLEVVLRIRIDVDGSVSDVEPVDVSPGQRDFYASAEAAVRQWKFRPRFVDGVAVERTAEMPVEFRMPKRSRRLGVTVVHFDLDDAGEPQDLSFSPRIPRCHDRVAIEAEIKAIIRVSNAAKAVRRGELDERSGRLQYELPPCPDEDG